MNLGRGRVIATRSSAFSLSNEDDGEVRLFVPLWKKVDIRTGSLRCVVSPGSALVSSHGPLSRDYSESARILIASFPRQLVSGALECLSGEDHRPENFPPMFRHGAQIQMVRRQLLSLVRCIDDSSDAIINAPRFRLAHEELLLLHLAQVLATSGKGTESGDGPSSPLVGRAIDFINAHLYTDIGPMAVAQAAGCSLRNLQLLFRKQHGRTLTAFIRDLRLRSARELLLQGRGEASVTTVALECGFSHLSDFARHYRAAFGEAPSQTARNARVRRSGSA